MLDVHIKFLADDYNCIITTIFEHNTYNNRQQNMDIVIRHNGNKRVILSSHAFEQDFGRKGDVFCKIALFKAAISEIMRENLKEKVEQFINKNHERTNSTNNLILHYLYLQG